MKLISIRYNEPDPSTYGGVVLIHSDQEHEVIQTGRGPSWDFAVAHMVVSLEGEAAIFSSSVDHFVLDGGELDSSDVYMLSLITDQAFRNDVNRTRMRL